RNDRMRSPIAAKALVRRIGHALSNPRGLFFPGNVMPRRNVASEGWKEVNSGSVSGPTREWLRGQNPTLASFGGALPYSARAPARSPVRQGYHPRSRARGSAYLIRREVFRSAPRSSGKTGSPSTALRTLARLGPHDGFGLPPHGPSLHVQSTDRHGVFVGAVRRLGW